MLQWIPAADPIAWLLLLPLLGLMLGARYFHPRHELAQFWCELMQREAQTWWMLGLRPLPSWDSHVGRAAYWTAVTALTLAAAASFNTWLNT